MTYDKGTDTPQQNHMKLADIWRLIRMNWHWFAISIFICCTLGVLYIISAPNVYTRSTVIMIQNQSNNRLTPQIMSNLMPLGLASRSSIQNEIQIFKSPNLMERAVGALELEKTYTQRIGMRVSELYTESPVKFQTLDVADDNSASFHITPLSGTEVEISNFRNDKRKIKGKPMKVFLMDTVSTPIGRVVVTPTLHYGSDFYGKKIRVAKNMIQAAAENFTNSLSVDQASKQTSMIALSLPDISKKRADDLMNKLIELFDESSILQEQKQASIMSEFVDARLVLLEQEIQVIEGDIEHYMSGNLISDGQLTAEQNLLEQTQYKARVFELENQRTISQYLRDYLTNPANADNLLPANTELKDLDISTQIIEYNTMLLNRDKLIANSSERNPIVTDLNKSLVAIRNSITMSIENLITGFELQLSGFKAKQVENRNSIAAMPGQELYLASVERQLKIKESLFVYLLQMREQSHMQVASATGNIWVVTPPSGKLKPTAPINILVMMISFIIGLIIPAITYWTRNIFNTSVRGKREITGSLSLPFLGEVPASATDGKNSQNFSQAFDILRQKIGFIPSGVSGPKVISFTTFGQGSGKTSVLSNLASSYGDAGKKTVIVDLDLRQDRPEVITEGDKAGVSAYLFGSTNNLSEIITRHPSHSNVDSINAGILPPNPAELIAGERFGRLIAALRERYDIVLLDMPAVSRVTHEALSAGRESDLTVFVIRAKAFDRRTLPKLEALYKKADSGSMATLYVSTHRKFL